MITVRLPAELEERLNALAKATNRSKSYYVREALEQALEDFEDAYLAEKRLAEIKVGKRRTYTLDEVARRLGLDD